VSSGQEHIHVVISLKSAGVYGPKLIERGCGLLTLGMDGPRLNLRAICQLVRAINKEKPDIVQTWMYHSDLLGSIALLFSRQHIPIIWGIRGPFDSHRTSTSTRLVVYSCAILSKFIPYKIVSNSESAKRRHITIGYSANKILVIPNGYPPQQAVTTQTASSALRRSLKLAPETVLLGMVARFDSHKDHANLLAALAEVKTKGQDFHCVLIGDEMLESNSIINGLVRRSDLERNISLLGPRDEVPNLLAQLDLHVLASAAESFPNVLAEAMNSGTPCVSTNVGDAAQIMGDCGWLVPPEDSTALALAILEAIAEWSSAQALWENRRERCIARITQNFGIERMKMNFSELWNRALNNSKSA